MSVTDSSSLVYDLACETIDWMAEDCCNREDVATEVFAFTLATYYRGRAITPRGFDVTDELSENGRCIWCARHLVLKPEKELCRFCFFGEPGPYHEDSS